MKEGSSKITLLICFVFDFYVPHMLLIWHAFESDHRCINNWQRARRYPEWWKWAVAAGPSQPPSTLHFARSSSWSLRQSVVDFRAQSKCLLVTGAGVIQVKGCKRRGRAIPSLIETIVVVACRQIHFLQLPGPGLFVPASSLCFGSRTPSKWRGGLGGAPMTPPPRKRQGNTLLKPQ